ncbi:hypothetical protein WH240_15480 [Gluconobacter wancherniae]
MADDRVATIVDGMRIASACPNHMNPAMSYIDPDSVSHAVGLHVYAQLQTRQIKNHRGLAPQ